MKEGHQDHSIESTKKHNLLTLAALGFLAYYVVAMWHEVLGHGVAYYPSGARHFDLTSTSMDSEDATSILGSRVLAGRFMRRPDRSRRFF